MKNLILIAMTALALTIFNGCQKENPEVDQLVDGPQPQEAVKQDVYVENGYLAFKNIEIVDSVITMLSQMSSEEKHQWEKSLNFISARSEFEKLFNEYEKIGSYEEFESFKNKNSKNLTFNEIDNTDLSINYPYATHYFVPVLNNKGLVKIGESLIKYTKQEHIVIKNGNLNALNNLSENIDNGNIFIFPKLKSTYKVDDLIHDFPEDNPFGAPSPWHQKTNSRKLKNELRIERLRYYEYNYQTLSYDWVRGYKVYFKQQAQKKALFGWKDYKTTYTFDDLQVKVGDEPISYFYPHTPPISPEVSPHATIDLYWYVFRMPYNPNIVPPLLSIPDISISIMTSCQGFDGVLYKVDYIEHSGFPGSGIPFNPVPVY